MTKPLPFAPAAVRRLIRSARAEGVEVTAVTVHPDGAVTVHKTSGTQVADAAGAEHHDAEAWETFQA